MCHSEFPWRRHIEWISILLHWSTSLFWKKKEKRKKMSLRNLPQSSFSPYYHRFLAKFSDFHGCQTCFFTQRWAPKIRETAFPLIRNIPPPLGTIIIEIKVKSGNYSFLDAFPYIKSYEYPYMPYMNVLGSFCTRGIGHNTDFAMLSNYIIMQITL